MAIHTIPLINGCVSYVSDSRDEALYELPCQFARGEIITVSGACQGIVSNIGIFVTMNPTKELKGKFYTKIFLCRVGQQVLVKKEIDLLALNPENKLSEKWREALEAL